MSPGPFVLSAFIGGNLVERDLPTVKEILAMLRHGEAWGGVCITPKSVSFRAPL